MTTPPRIPSPTPSRISLTFPKAPSLHNTLEDPNETLAWIEQRLRELISAVRSSLDDEPVLDIKTYMAIYTTIHNYTRPQRYTSGAELRGATLYQSLRNTITSHSKDVRSHIFQQQQLSFSNEADDSDHALLETYLTEWKRHLTLSRLTSHLLDLLSRHWITRVHDESRKHADVCTIPDLFKRIWREQVVIGALPANEQESGAPTGNGFESILDVASRFRDRVRADLNDNTVNLAKEDPANQEEKTSATLANEVFATFFDLGITTIHVAGESTSTWHATEKAHKLSSFKTESQSLPSGLTLTRLSLNKGQTVKLGRALLAIPTIQPVSGDNSVSTPREGNAR